MKKFLALAAVLSLLTFAGSAFATSITATPTTVMLIRGVVDTAVATVSGTASHNGRLEYSKVSGPDWATLSGTTVTFAPSSSTASGQYTVTIRVTETYGDDPSAAGHAVPQTETADVTITANIYVIVPVRITANTPSVSLQAGSTTTATVTGTPMNSGVLSYSIVTGPTWATLSGSTVTFAPDRSVAAGAYDVVVRATETFMLPDGTSRTTTADATITANVSAYVIPVTPTTSSDKTTGDADSKKTDAPVAVTTETKVTTVTKTVTKTVTISTFGDVIVAAQKIVSTLTAAETKQTVTETLNSSKVETTTAVATAATTALQTTAINTETGAIADTKSVATAVIAAVTSASTTATTDATGTAVKTAMASALMLGSATATEGNLSNITDKAITKADGTLETPGETILRLINEALDAVAETFASAATKQSIANMVVNTDGSVTIEVKETSTLKTVSTTKTITNADGTTSTVTNEETYNFTEVMSMLATQASESGTDAEQAEIASEVPAAVLGTVEPEEHGVYTFNTQQKPDTWGKKAKGRAHNRDKRARSASAAALDATEVGSSVLLNSAAEETDHIPAENEWSKDGSKMIVPGYLTIAMYLEPGVETTPILTMPAEEASKVEGISTSTATEEVTVETTETIVLENVPVYDTAEYSTSFDTDAFDAMGYNTALGYFIVAGEAGAYSLGAADDNMLAATDRAVVQTLPKLAIKGDNASDTATYVIKTRLRVPVDTDTSAISSADHLLEFWPNGLTATDAAGNTVSAGTGDATFFASDGTTEITDNVVRAVAKKQAGYQISDTVWGYDCYAAMTLDKLAENDDPYMPVITVKVEDVVTESPDKPTSPDQPVTTTLGLSASASTVNIVLGNSRTVTLSATNIQGTATYSFDAPTAAGVTLSGNTATIKPTAVGTYAVRFTVTDSGRTTNNTATASVTVNVTEASEEPGVVGGVGSSGGGCDAGFGALALALLGGFIAARKK